MNDKREQERQEAQAALAKIAQETGINPEIKEFPECPCEQLKKTVQLIGILRRENRELKKNIREFVEIALSAENFYQEDKKGAMPQGGKS